MRKVYKYGVITSIMPQLLKPAKLDPKFEYEIKKNGEIYIAGAENCRLHNGRNVLGNLLLDKLNIKNRIKWAPKLLNPFATKTIQMEKRNSELYIPQMIIASSGWENENSALDNFVKDAEEEILQKYQSRMNLEDIKLFFKQVHQHYRDYFINF